jgi:hypothetical protein
MVNAKIKNTLVIGTAALGLTLATVCNDSSKETIKQSAINALENRLNIEDTISTRYKIINDSAYTRTYPSGIVDTNRITIIKNPGANPGETIYEFDFHDILPSYAKVKMVDGKPVEIYVRP